MGVTAHYFVQNALVFGKNKKKFAIKPQSARKCCYFGGFKLFRQKNKWLLAIEEMCLTLVAFMNSLRFFTYTQLFEYLCTLQAGTCCNIITNFIIFCYVFTGLLPVYPFIGP